MNICTKWCVCVCKRSFWILTHFSSHLQLGKISLHFAALVPPKHTEHNKTRVRASALVLGSGLKMVPTRMDKITILSLSWEYLSDTFLFNICNPFALTHKSFFFFWVLLSLDSRNKGNKENKDMKGPETISWHKFHLQKNSSQEMKKKKKYQTDARQFMTKSSVHLKEDNVSKIEFCFIDWLL